MPPLLRIKDMTTNELVNVRRIVPLHRKKEASKVIDNIISSTAMLYCSTIILSAVLGGFAYVR